MATLALLFSLRSLSFLVRIFIRANLLGPSRTHRLIYRPFPSVPFPSANAVHALVPDHVWVLLCQHSFFHLARLRFTSVISTRFSSFSSSSSSYSFLFIRFVFLKDRCFVSIPFSPPLWLRFSFRRIAKPAIWMNFDSLSFCYSCFFLGFIRTKVAFERPKNLNVFVGFRPSSRLVLWNGAKIDLTWISKQLT